MKTVIRFNPVSYEFTYRNDDGALHSGTVPPKYRKNRTLIREYISSLSPITPTPTPSPPLPPQIVEKIVYVDRPTIIEKEIPTEKIIEKIVEVPVIQYVDKIVEKIVEKIIEKPMDRVVIRIIKTPIPRILYLPILISVVELGIILKVIYG